ASGAALADAGDNILLCTLSSLTSKTGSATIATSLPVEPLSFCALRMAISVEADGNTTSSFVSIKVDELAVCADGTGNASKGTYCNAPSVTNTSLRVPSRSATGPSSMRLKLLAFSG